MNHKIKTPDVFKWTPRDFKWAMIWAKCQTHPNDNNKSLWDYLYSSRLSAEEVLHEINKLISLEKK